MRVITLVVFQVMIVAGFALADYQLGEHPRVLISPETLPLLAQRATGDGILASDYQSIKAEADRMVAEGTFRNIANKYLRPEGMLCSAIAYLVEKELGNDSAFVYADAVKKLWDDGTILSTTGSEQFGSFALAYDWIYSAMSAYERKKFGDHLGGWLYHYTDTPRIVLRYGDFLYNQTWGPEHLSTPHCRDGITHKLFLSLALAGAGTVHEAASLQFLDSFSERIPRDCIPRFDLIGGVWSESMGHGTYGPTRTIPWAFEAWRTSTGLDWFKLGSETTFLKEMNYWALHTTVPFSGFTAGIDDNYVPSTLEKQWGMTAPILGARYNDPVANYVAARLDGGTWPENMWRIPWLRFITFDSDAPQLSPGQAGWPTARLFEGAGHVYMRSAWDDPDATWSFFGAGPRFAGHSLDDEGHFMIASKGWLVLRAGGRGDNNVDYYSRGSLVFNIVTIFDPQEQYAKVDGSRTDSERDGGIIRVDALGGAGTDTKHRGHIAAYRDSEKFTYSAADLTRAYSSAKSDEVTRQYLYIKGEREFFVIFDRVGATSAEYPKHWFLHIPTEPAVSGQETEITVGHVYSSQQPDYVTWLSDPAGYDPLNENSGRSRAFLKTVLPTGTTLTRRGGAGHERWGHPNEPTAQYNHRSEHGHLPPHAPWRLEIEAPMGSEREYFLHVLEIGNEDDQAMSEVSLIERDSTASGVMITPEGAEPIEVLFNLQGELDAWIKKGVQGEFEKISAGIDPPVNPALRGDFNGDGALGIIDAVELIIRGVRDSSNEAVDFNNDGNWSLSDVVDFIAYLREWNSMMI
jgi:hypothetical protein